MNSAAIKRIPEIIMDAQRDLLELQEKDTGLAAQGKIEHVLDRARYDLERFASRRVESHIPSRIESSPESTQEKINKVLFGILLGVMVREVLFEAIEQQFRLDPLPRDFHVDYTTIFVGEYLPDDGEHQFMTEMVRSLDNALRVFYKRPISKHFRVVLRDITRRLPQTDFAPNLSIDVWTADIDELLQHDVIMVREQVRRTYRHNAETAMLFVRDFPAAILDAYEITGSKPPDFTLLDLQTHFLRALPIFSATAGTRLRTSLPQDPKDRMVGTMRSDSLICELDGDEIMGFKWAAEKLRRPQHAGHCPAASSLPLVSARQQEIVNRMGHLDTRCGVRNTIEYITPTTAELLLRLSAFHAPDMWGFQYEANALCSAFLHPNAPLRSLHDVAREIFWCRT